MKYKQGDVIFIPYPYTDLSNTKKRPVVIISKDSINKNNFIVSKIISKKRNDSFSFELKENDLIKNICLESEVRTNEIFTVNFKIINRKISSLKPDTLKKLLDAIKKNISYEEKKVH